MVKQMGDGQRDYESRRAAKAGKSLDKWLAEKDRASKQARAKAEQAAQTRAATAAPRKPGLIGRLLERAHKPL